MNSPVCPMIKRNRGLTVLLAMFGAIVLCTGCGGKTFDVALDTAFKKLFRSKRTPQQNMIIAVSDTDPDLRRDAVARVANSKQMDREWAVKGFIAIALLENDPQARCVAIRALGRSNDARAVETMLKLLNYTEQPVEEVRPPEAICRWDAMAALADLLAAGNVPDDLFDAVKATLLKGLTIDDDRHVRTAAARGLGHYFETDVVRALIDALIDLDFAVAHECETSLVRLTGRTHSCDRTLWNAWYEINRDDLFAHAGEIPDSRRRPYRNRWEKAGYKMREFFRWMVPARKT